MSDNVGISFKDALQEALAEEDSAESDLAPTAIEVVSESEAPVVDQPVVESNEDAGVFDSMFVEKDEGQLPQGEEPLTIKIDGRLMTIPEIEAEIMMHADYTRKTQEISELRKEAEKALVLWRALEDKPQETVRALWQRVSNGQPPQGNMQAQPQNTDVEALVEKKLQEMLQTDPRLRAIEAEAAWKEVDVILDKIAEDNNVTFTMEHKQRVLEKAQELGTDNLQAAFDVLRAEKLRWDQQRANVAANASQPARNSAENGNDTTPKTFSSWREAMDDSLREDNVLDTVFNFA